MGESPTRPGSLNASPLVVHAPASRPAASSARMPMVSWPSFAMPASREKISAYAPHITTLKINRAKIGELIGPGGKVIRGIVEQTGCKIDVEDDGSVKVYSTDGVAADKCIQMITDICAVAEITIEGSSMEKYRSFTLGVSMK